MKVLFLTTKSGTPSTRWRVGQLLPALRATGLQVDAVEMTGGVISKLGAIQRAGEYDVVVLQKRLLPKLLNHRLRSVAKRLVFEFDDAVDLKKTDTGVRVSTTRERRFRRILRAVDAVIVPNDHLADLARRETDDPARVHVLPTAVDLAKWAPRPPARREWPYTIGWVGTAANVHALEIIAPALVKSSRRHRDLRLRVICDAKIEIPEVQVEHQPFSAENEAADLRSLDIAVAPLVEDAWTRGKVSTKILAYFAAGVPTVASDVNAHRFYIEPGRNGFLAGTLAQWEDALEKLLASPELRDQVGGAARRTAEERFSLDSVAPKYAALFRSLLETAPAVDR